MEGSTEQKWTTVRDIAPPQVKSAEEDRIAEVPDLPSVVEDTRSVNVLVMHPKSSTARLIRETLENFTNCHVTTTADPLRAFELSLQQPFGLFLFAMKSVELSGPMLYELICRACAAGRGLKSLAPAVIFVREKEDAKLSDEMKRDVRIKDVVNKPIRIERLLEAVGGVLEVRDPTVLRGNDGAIR